MHGHKPQVTRSRYTLSTCRAASTRSASPCVSRWHTADLPLFGSVYNGNCKNASVHWPNVTHNVALAQEVISNRHSGPQAWGDITGRLSTAFAVEDKPVQLGQRLQGAHELPAG